MTVCYVLDGQCQVCHLSGVLRQLTWGIRGIPESQAAILELLYLLADTCYVHILGAKGKDVYSFTGISLHASVPVPEVATSISIGGPVGDLF